MIAMVQVEKWKRMRFREKLAFRFRQYALEKEEIQSPWGSYLLLHACDRKIRWDQPVSYTHLDVYKRQQLIGSNAGKFPDFGALWVWFFRILD